MGGERKRFKILIVCPDFFCMCASSSDCLCADTADKEQMMELTTIGLNLGIPSYSVSHQHCEGVSLCVSVRARACSCVLIHTCVRERARRASETLNLLSDRSQICLTQLKSNLVGGGAE